MTNPFAMDAPTTATATVTSPPPAANPFAAAPPAAAPAPAAPQGGTYGPPASARPAPGGEDPFSAPAPQQARGPRLRDIYGRLLLVIPYKLEEGVSSQFKNPDGSTQMQDRMTADVIVLDGGPIHYGGKPEAVPPIPHDKTAQTPHKTARMYISNVGLISQCRDALAKRITQGQPGMVLGRLTKGDNGGKGEPPWLLTVPTEQDKMIARAYLATVDPFA